MSIKSTCLRQSISTTILILSSVFVPGLISGCETSSPPQLETYPVTGIVHYQGTPAQGAEIRLKPSAPLADPAGRSVEPYGVVDSSGYFTISTYGNGDGAPPGDYTVTVYWPVVTIEGGEPVFGPDRLQNRYRDPASSSLRIKVVDSINSIPDIHLK